MKKIEKIYFILTYLFFIYPPFIWGIVEIYSNRGGVEVHITSLIVNVVLIAVIGAICALLIQRKELHIPSKLERNHLIFGVIGNVVMYFYTFQNMMNIDNIVTIYLALLIILVVEYLLISRKIRAKELWILLSIFLVMDYLHLIVTGCGYADNYLCTANRSGDLFLTIMFSITLLVVYGYYIYRIVSYKVMDLFKIVNVIFVFVLSLSFQNIDNMDENFLLTISILLPFFVIVDFVVKIVNKTYNHKTLLFYLRTTTILAVSGVLGVMDFFGGNMNIELLPIMVLVTYSSLATNILTSVSRVNVTDENLIKTFKQAFNGLTISGCSVDELEKINEQYGEEYSKRIILDGNSYSLVCMVDDLIVGFISSSIRELPVPLDDQKEIVVNIINIKEEYRDQELEEKLIRKVVKQFKDKDVIQLRIWSSSDDIEGITYWNKLGYVISSETSKEGYYFIKKTF